MREAILKYVRNAVQMKSHLPQHDQGRNPLNQLLQMALLFDKSELQCRAYLVAALCLHDAVFSGTTPAAPKVVNTVCKARLGVLFSCERWHRANFYSRSG